MSEAVKGKLRVLVVDDELPARLRLRDLLAGDPEVSEVLEASDGETAVQLIRERKPDLVLLDVQMPELDGLGVVMRVGPERMPLTVFVTAYDQHAIRAFEANALDYVLKPYSDERIEAAMARAKQRLRESQLGEFARALLSGLADDGRAERYLDRFAVKDGGVTRLIPAGEVEWIEAAGVYITLHASSGQHLVRTAMSEVLSKLDPAMFVRVHRSAIVNVDSIVRLRALSHGEFEAHVKSGARVRVSRSYRAQLEKRLGQTL